MICVGPVLAGGKLAGVVLVDRGGVPGLPKLGSGGGWLGAVVGRKVCGW